MLCPPSIAGGQRTVAIEGSEMDHHTMGVADHAGHEHTRHQHPEHDSDAPGMGGHHDGFGKCDLCGDFCSMTPMLSALPSIPTPLTLSSVLFPDLSAPAPSFLSDGQERPPRSI